MLKNIFIFYIKYALYIHLLGPFIIGFPLILASILFGITKGSGKEIINDGSFTLTVGFISYFLLLLYFVKKRGIKKFFKLRYKLLLIKQLSLIANIIIWCLAFVILDTYINEKLDLPDYHAETFSLLGTSIFGIVTTCLIGPVVEEYAFRGVIERLLLQKKNDPWFAIFLSSLLLGIVHLNPIQCFSATCLGLILGWIYYKTNSILYTSIVHITSNVVATILTLKYGITIDISTICVKTNTSLSLVLVIALILFFLSIIIFNKLTCKKQ